MLVNSDRDYYQEAEGADIPGADIVVRTFCAHCQALTSERVYPFGTLAIQQSFLPQHAFEDVMALHEHLSECLEGE